MREQKEKSSKVSQRLTSLSQPLAISRARMAIAKQESEKKESQSSTDCEGDKQCARCHCARAVVSTDHNGRDLGEPTYCLRCSEMLVARALKDWRLCR